MEEQPFEVPDQETVLGLSVEELTELGLQIRENVKSKAEMAQSDDAVLSEVNELIDAFNAVQAIIADHEAKAAALAAARDRVAAFATDEPEVVEEAQAVEEVETVVEAEVAEASAETESDAVEATTEAPAEAAAEVEVEAATETVEEAAAEVVESAEEPEVVAEAAIEPEAVQEAAVETEVEAEATAEVEAATEEPATEEAAVTETETASTEQPEEGDEVDNSNETASELADTRSEALEPETVEVETGIELRAQGMGTHASDGQIIDTMTLATAISEMHRRKRNHVGEPEYVSLALAAVELEPDVTLAGDSNLEDNFRLFSAAADQAQEALNSAIVASGGVCAPLQQDYTFFRLAEEMNPVERALPTVPARRGGIRYISPPDFRDAAPGVRVTTEEQDAAGYTTLDPAGPTEPKPCVRVECPDILECRVDAVSRCVTFGNLNYRVFPEQVAAFLADLSVIFTETKEIFYLDAIDAASTPVTAANDYGATRAIIHDLLVASANYRRRHHMSPTATLQLFLPSWVPELLKVDMVNDHSLGLNFVSATMADINRAFAQMNLTVAFYYDSATGAGQAFNFAQAAGGINNFPDTVVSYLFAPGTFVRLDAGTLDVGLVRDSVLNSTNDLQLFAEQWIQVCMVGIESLRIEHTLCPNGTAPEPVTPMECVAGSS